MPPGGTILGAANRGNPYARKAIRDGREVTIDVSDEIIRGIKRLEMDALPVLGGDGTLHIAHGLFLKGAPIIGVPRMIDNDIGGTEVTFGFDSRKGDEISVPRLGGIGQVVGEYIERQGFEARLTVLGHLQRGTAGWRLVMGLRQSVWRRGRNLIAWSRCAQEKSLISR